MSESSPLKTEQFPTDPERAREIAEDIFRNPGKDVVAKYFLGGEEFAGELSDELYQRLTDRFGHMGVGVIESTRKAPITGCEGSYECAKTFLHLGPHELLHAAISWHRTKDPTPLFLKKESQVNDQDLFAEELYAQLGGSTARKLLSKPTPFSIAKLDFSIWAGIALHPIVYLEFIKENPDASLLQTAQFHADFFNTWVQTFNGMDEDFFMLLKKIHSEANQKPPQHDAMVRWFLEVTEDYPEYEY